MNCARFRRILAGFQEGTLQPDEQSSAMEHLEKCRGCRQLLDVAAAIWTCSMKKIAMISPVQYFWAPAVRCVSELRRCYGVSRQARQERRILN